MTSPYMAALGLPGLEIEQHGLYASLLMEIERRELNASHLKVGLAHELSLLVFLKPRGKGRKAVDVPRDKLSISEFCQKSPKITKNHQKITKKSPKIIKKSPKIIKTSPKIINNHQQYPPTN